MDTFTREILKLGEKRCKVIGTGALFSRNNTNINSQFNIIHYNYDRITEISNCRYNADGGNIPWNICDLMENSYEYVFEGKSFEDVYKQLLNMLNSLTPLYNVVLRINTEYSEFCESLEKFLKEDYMKIGEKNIIILIWLKNGRQMKYQMIYTLIMVLILR